MNTIAQYELQQGIALRCGYNGFCAQALLQQLNVWYAPQYQTVNQWYSTIAGQCSSKPVPRRTVKTRPTPDDEIDVEDLEVDKEDKSVRIRIPSSPSGYRSRR